MIVKYKSVLIKKKITYLENKIESSILKLLQRYMKTNQMLTVNFGGHSMSIEHKTGMGNLTELWGIGNAYRAQRGLEPLDYLNGWLFKLNPSKVAPEARDRVLTFHLIFEIITLYV